MVVLVVVLCYVQLVLEKFLYIVAEWSKALDLGSSLCWRGFKSHRCQLYPRIYTLCVMMYHKGWVEKRYYSNLSI